MSSNFGNHLKISIFGQSHGGALGVVMDGLPAGEMINKAAVQSFLRRRMPGISDLVTQRREEDAACILSGLYEGRTCGAPLCAVIRNTNAQSSEYEDLKNIPRPSHADYPAYVKNKGFNDPRGGGHTSGRITAALCFAGGLAQQILKRRDIEIGAHILSVASIKDQRFDPVDLTASQLKLPGKRAFPVVDEDAGLKMTQLIEAAKNANESLGGRIECAVSGLPAGLGEPIFDGLENKLSQALFAIPGVKGVEFGDGFGLANLKGSDAADCYEYKDGKVVTKKNHNGGILGGMATGMPLLFNVAIKPTPSVAQHLDSVDLKTGENTVLQLKGRHDPCIVLRAVPCVEAAAALSILDLMLTGGYI